MPSLYGSTIDVGPGIPAFGDVLGNPDPAQDYISAGPGRLTPGVPQLLSAELDDVTRNFGLRTYEAMLTDPAVWSSYLALKLAILNGPIQVLPAIRPKGYRYRPPAVRATEAAKSKPADAGPKLTGDEAQAQEAADFFEREIRRLRTPFKMTLLQMLDAMAFGCKLAEKTREVPEAGPDAGKLVLKSIKVKPAWAWNFVVDPTLEVHGILTFVPPDAVKGVSGGFAIIPRDKFAVLTWLPKDNDPRGTSALRAAYDWWNLKTQSKPSYYKHLYRFASPSLDGELSPNDSANGPARNPVTGAEIAGRTETPGQRFANQLIAFQNNSVLVRPAGSKLNVIEPRTNGEAFLNAFDLFDRQICLAVGLQVRASLEAKNGSKADSETAQDTRGLVIEFGRECVGDMGGREIARESIALNMGEDVAEHLTPCLSIGQTESQDKAAKWKASASIGFKLGPSQLPEMDAELGLPDRDLEADAQAAKDQMEAQAALKPPPGGPGAGGPGDNKGAAGKPGQGGKAPGGDEGAK